MGAINERFRAVRKELGLNQTEYGEKLGLQQGSVGDIERSRDGVGVSEAVRLLMISEYSVNRLWLEHGSGEVFHKNKNTITNIVKEPAPYQIFDSEIATLKSKLEGLEKELALKNELLELYRSRLPAK